MSKKYPLNVCYLNSYFLLGVDINQLNNHQCNTDYLPNQYLTEIIFLNIYCLFILLSVTYAMANNVNALITLKNGRASVMSPVIIELI